MELKEAHIDNEEQKEQELWKQLPGKEGEERADILIELAKQAIYRSQGAEALALTEEAHQIYKSIGANASNVDLANAITGISHSLKELNRADEAVKVIDGAIELLREGNYPFVVDTLRTKASWLSDLGKYEDAISTYLEVIQINEIEGEIEFFARDLLAISVCYTKMSKWHEVLDHASKARASFKAEKLVDEVAWCDLQIANAYLELGNSEFASDIGQRSYDIGELRGHLAIKCSAALLLGKIEVIKGQFDAADSRFEEARSIASGSNDWETIIKIEKEFINLYLVQGKVSAAEDVERRLNSLREIVDC